MTGTASAGCRPGTRVGHVNLVVVFVVTFVNVGCAKRYPALMTAWELRAYDEGEALVTYLAQPHASPSVCDARRAEHRSLWFQPSGLAALDGAFHSGRVSPSVWRGCVGALLASGDAAVARRVANDVTQAAQTLVDDSLLDADQARQARALAVLDAYAERPPRVVATAPLGTALSAASLAGKERRLAEGFRARLVSDFVELAELEIGRWKGRAVDETTLAAMASGADERSLWWAAHRLPSEAAREASLRWLVRLRVEASPLPEVRERAAEVEALVLRTGQNAVSLATHPPKRGWLHTRPPGSELALVIDQRREDAMARLLAAPSPGAPVGLVPEVPLRGAAFFEIAGFSVPLTLCAPREAYAVEPCVRAAELRFWGLPLRVSEGGELRLEEALSTAELIAAARRGPRVEVVASFEGAPLLRLQWPLAFAMPDDMVFAAQGPSMSGPALDVRVEELSPGILLYTVTVDGATERAVVPRERADAFHIVSRGRNGEAGRPGDAGGDGAAGMDGTDAACPERSGSSGADGANGQDGQRGGDGEGGGDGGPIRVTVVAPERNLEELLAVLRTTVQSLPGEGGDGGRGGAGGSGGRGGSGGSGTTCFESAGDGSWRSGTSSLSSGSDGSRGRDGNSGSNGWPGRRGQPGQVLFSVERGGAGAEGARSRKFGAPESVRSVSPNLGKEEAKGDWRRPTLSTPGRDEDRPGSRGVPVHGLGDPLAALAREVVAREGNEMGPASENSDVG